jgi:hypothetical protein
VEVRTRPIKVSPAVGEDWERKVSTGLVVRHCACENFSVSKEDFRSLKVRREVCLRYTEDGKGNAEASIADPGACHAEGAARVTASEAGPSPHLQ